MPISGNKIATNSIVYTKLREDTIQFEVPITLFAGEKSIAIDSTGTKLTTAKYLVSSELVKHLKSAYLETAITDFGATDASLSVTLTNATDATNITSITVTSNTERSRSSDIASALSGLAGKEIQASVSVDTASATAGATANVKNIRLVLVLGIS